MIIVMTGCVEPANVFELTLKNSNERLLQYINAMKFYLSCGTIDKVVFCDNSDYSYDYLEVYEFAAKHDKKLEILRYREDYETMTAKGKGYGEGRILEYVIANSTLLKSEDYFYKVTGRLIIENIDKIITLADTKNNYCNKNLFVYNTIDTRFFGIKKQDYIQYFNDLHNQVNDSAGIYLEHCYYRAFHDNKITYHCHNNLPIYIGVSGTTGETYQETNKLWLFLTKSLSILGLYNKHIFYRLIFFIHAHKKWFFM